MHCIDKFHLELKLYHNFGIIILAIKKLYGILEIWYIDIIDVIS
jgi:hypothetical protein